MPLINAGGKRLVGMDGLPLFADAAALSDAAANPTTGTIGAVGLAYNGATFERLRSNTEGTALALAARTADTASSDFTNQNARGLLCILRVTVASGTGGLTVRLQAKDPVSGTAYVNLNAAPTAIVAVSTSTYFFYPGVTGATGLSQVNAVALPRTWRINVTVGDSTSYTYSVSYHTII